MKPQTEKAWLIWSQQQIKPICTVEKETILEEYTLWVEQALFSLHDPKIVLYSESQTPKNKTHWPYIL